MFDIMDMDLQSGCCHMLTVYKANFVCLAVRFCGESIAPFPDVIKDYIVIRDYIEIPWGNLGKEGSAYAYNR